MNIDEEGLMKPTKYTKKKITRTDHNTIFIDLKVKKLKMKVENKSFLNTKCYNSRNKFIEEIKSNEKELSTLFTNINCDVNDQYQKLSTIWNNMKSKSFRKVSPIKKKICGVDD